MFQCQLFGECEDLSFQFAEAPLLEMKYGEEREITLVVAGEDGQRRIKLPDFIQIVLFPWGERDNEIPLQRLGNFKKECNEQSYQNRQGKWQQQWSLLSYWTQSASNESRWNQRSILVLWTGMPARLARLWQKA